MPACRHVECSSIGAVNDFGTCASCESVTKKIQNRIKEGALPRIPQREVKGPRTTARSISTGGMRCIGCDKPIDGQHWAYPDYPNPRSSRRHDLHFHELCHAIWEEEATVSD